MHTKKCISDARDTKGAVSYYARIQIKNVSHNFLLDELTSDEMSAGVRWVRCAMHGRDARNADHQRTKSILVLF